MSEPFNPAAEAKRWVDSVNGTDGGLFRHWRVSLLSKGRPRNPLNPKPLRIRRFVEGCPPSCMKEAVEYLLSIAPYSDIVFNGQRVSGSYRPTRTYWRRDDGESVNSAGRTDGTYTLVQDLVDSDVDDSESAQTSDSCSEEAYTEWHWGDSGVGSVPPSTGTEQGVTYAVTGVRQNEDGTYDWSMVKRVAKTQMSLEALATSDEYGSAFVQTWDNLYGGPGSFRDEGGAAVDVASAVHSAAGTVVERNVSQNPDCTYKVTVTRKTSTRKTDAQKSRQKTLRGVTETTVDRNVTDSSVSTPNVGDRVQVELNPDGKYTRTETHVVPETVGDIGSNCHTTVFEHQHAKVRNEASRPSEEASSAGGGKTYQVQARATEEGTWDVTRTVTSEIASSGAQHSKRKTLRGVIETTVDRNGTDASVSVSEVGDEVRVEMTPGGLYNRTETHLSKEPIGTIGENCQNMSDVHSDSTTENVSDKPVVKHQPAKVNQESVKTSRMTEEGSWDVETRTVVHRQFGPHTILSTGNSLVTVTKDIFKNLPSVPSRSGSTNKDVDVSASRNDYGSFSGSTETRTYNPVGPVTTSTVSNRFRTTNTKAFQNQTSVIQPSVSGDNADASVSVSMNQHGSYDGNLRETTFHPVGPEETSRVSNRLKTVVTRAFQNHVGVVKPSVSGDNTDASVSVSMNDHGTYDGNIREVQYKAVGPVTVATVAGPVRTTTIKAYQNQESPINPEAFGPNVDASASASMNDHGTYDGTSRVTSYVPCTLTATSNWATETRTTVVSHHTSNQNPQSSMGEASGSPDDLGGYSTTVTTCTPKPVSSGWITWDSTVKQKSGIYKYHHGFVVFKNQGSVPAPPRGTNVNVDANVNKYGLFDGKISYSELYDWSENDSATGGSHSVSASIYMIDSTGKMSSKPVATASGRMFYGAGNDGAYASACENAVSCPGLPKLAGRVVWTSVTQ